LGRVNEIYNYFLRPYPLRIGLRKALRQGALFGFFVGAFLVFFRPFGLYSMDRKYDYILWGFGLITFLAAIVNDWLVPLLAPNWFREKKWVLWKEVVLILYNIWFIATANFAYMVFFTTTKLTWATYGQMSLYTLGIGSIPIGFGIAVRQHTLAQRYKKEAEAFHPQVSAEPDHSVLSVKGNNQKERIELKVNEFLFAEAEGNYVTMAFLKDDHLKKEMIRSTLKEVHDQFKGHSSIHQVHRSYLANLDLVDRVSGNSQGLQLHFNHSDAFVPVSRRKAREIKPIIDRTVRP